MLTSWQSSSTLLIADALLPPGGSSVAIATLQLSKQRSSKLFSVIFSKFLIILKHIKSVGLKSDCLV